MTRRPLKRSLVSLAVTCLVGIISLAPGVFAQSIDKWKIDSNKHRAYLQRQESTRKSVAGYDRL